MKHLVIFGIILFGVLLLTLSKSFNQKMENFNYSIYNGIYLGKSKIGGKYGRGVFSNKRYEPNDLIEQAPYIEDKVSKFNGISRDYIFSTKNNKAALGFGYVSLYNHNDNPNANWNIEDNNIVITAIKPINKNEEILISYGNQYWSSRDNLEKLK